MDANEFKELNLLERLKVQNISIDHSTAFNLYLYAKSMNEEEKFYNAFVKAISNERISPENNIYSEYFNGLNAKSYSKQLGQSMGGKISKRSKAKPKNTTKNETKLDV